MHGKRRTEDSLFNYVDREGIANSFAGSSFSNCQVVRAPFPEQHQAWPGLASACAREGADVAINYLPEEQSYADDVMGPIRGAGRKGVAIPGDLRSETFCIDPVNSAIRELGVLGVLVSNAGRQQAHAPILDTSTEQFDWISPIGAWQSAEARASRLEIAPELRASACATCLTKS